ncbi:hypothetical protein AB5N19_13817 [Seiridium cardinale]|uniref:Uncharacterized protein n=1 Tax=Seiridium cardinale TaxID=138064 RepID=A0ABR2XJ18_9PEZI
MQSQSIIFALTLQLFLVVSVPIDAQNATVRGSGELETRVGWHDGPTGRGTLALLYSCLITIFTCTWTVLHLNVPGLEDGLWTGIIRKTKWMAITILMPEFIFSKAICELRLALSDLHEFENMIRYNYKDTNRKDDLNWKIQSFNEQTEITWSWEVDYGNARFLYRLLGLPRLDNPAKPAAQEGNTKLTSVIVDSNTVPVESNPSDQKDSDGSKPPSEMPKEPRRPDTRRSQSAEHEEAVAEGVDFVPEGETVASKQALRIADARGSEAISAEGSGQKEEKPPEKNISSDGAEGKSREKVFLEKDRKDGENIRKEVTADDGADGDGEDNVQAESMSFTRVREMPRIRFRRLKKSRDSEKHNRPKILRFTHHVSRKWTLSHSYLANMGGLLYTKLYWEQDGVLKYCALTGAKLSRRYFWLEGSHPLKGLFLNDDEIADRSKADVLLRILSVLQISWLVLTSVTRGVTALPLTQLEIATLAFSLFAILTFAANWWKPKDISRPIQLQNLVSGLAYGEESVQEYDMELHAFDWTQSVFRRLLFPYQTKEDSRRIEDITRVPNDMIEMEGNVPLIFRLMAISALIFGAFHCLAWNFAFPSRAELILWRTSSIASAIVPIISLIASLYLNHLATAYVDRLLLSFLVDKLLNPLADCSPEYLKLLREPVFAYWSHDELRVLYSRPAGHRNFAEKPNEQEQESLKKKELWDVSESIHDMPIFLRDMSKLLKALEEVKKGKWNNSLLYKVSSCYLRMEYLYSTIIREVLDDYEQCYVKKKVPASSSDHHQTKYVKLIMDAWEPFREEREKLQEFRHKCEQVSTVLTICGGILYIITRVIILILLFTSLRDVPLGVYEQTPWTRFLPSFS